MKIFTIIVTYNGMRWYEKCLGSLRNSSLPTKVIVIDNASTDGSTSYIREHFPEVDLIESKENLGFAKANNIGIRKAYDAGADYIMLLNQDAWVESNTLSELVRTFKENENVGIASPIHLNGSYSGLDHKFHYCMSEEFISDLYMQKVKPYYDSKFVNAAAWLMSRHCIEAVGGFDTLLFFHYGEDVNYGQRVNYHGMKFKINTRCTICHDREERKKLDEKFETFMKKIPDLLERVELGDINQAEDIDRMIVSLQKKIIRKTLRGRFAAKKILKNRIEFLKEIRTSRNANKKTGLTWL